MSGIWSDTELRARGCKLIGRGISIHKSVEIFGHSITLHGPCRIDAYTVITCAGPTASLEVGRCCHIAPHCFLNCAGGLRLADGASIAAGGIIYTQSDGYVTPSLLGPLVPEKFRTLIAGPVRLERGVCLGARVTVLPGVRVGQCTTVGANSLLLKSTGDFEVWLGSPAAKHKDRDREALMAMLDEAGLRA